MINIKGLEGVTVKTIEVYNAIGEQVMETPFRSAGDQQIDVSGLGHGMYMIRMYDSKNALWLTQSFMKQ